MCTTCGCGQGEVRIEGEGHEASHAREHHHHDHHHHHAHDGEGAHTRGAGSGRIVQMEQDILAKNNRFAEENRRHFSSLGLLALNLVSSPGSGKTTLLTRTIEALKGRLGVWVIEGDQQTVHDADRIRETGVPAVQINTGKGCHLDAHMVGHAMTSLGAVSEGILFIENVGNLVCPAAFDLGEAHKVVILSVTEGEDKPIKYPDMFHAADLLILNKTDLLPYLDFDVERCVDYARRVNPGIGVIRLSAKSGEGLDAWYDWILDRLPAGRGAEAV